MLAKGQITVSNLDDGKTPFLHQAYKMKDGRFFKHYPVYEASPVNGYKEGDLWHRTDGSQPGYFVANKSNTTLNLNDWTFYANELAYSDTDKFYPKFEGTYSDYNEVASDDQTKYTWKIIKADDGIGIKSVKEYYAVSASNVTPPSLQSDWSETPKPTNTTNKYLWNYEVYTYSNGDTRETTKRVIGTHGATGATGNGITSVTNRYLATTLATGVTAATSGWTTAVQKTDPVKKYLWNYEEILYTNGSNIPTAPVIIGTHGEKGDNSVIGLLTNESITLPANKDGLVSSFVGANGVFDVYDGITKKTGTGTAYSVVGQPTNITVNIHATTGVYKVTAMPTGTTILNGHATLKAIYNGVTIEKQLNVAKSVTGATGAKGATGDRGPVGATGTSVSSVTEYYLATSESSGIKDTDTRFTTAMQPITATNKYLWNYEKINFSNGTSQPTIPVIIGVYGDKGQTGSTGATGRSITSITEHYLATSANSGVTRSTSGWKTTMQPTTETNKYLWNYETVNWSSGTTPTYVDPIIIGVHGAKGPQGATGASGKDGVAGKDGKGITSTTITYGLSTTDTVEPTKYTSNVPTLVKGQYLWTKTVWKYTDNTTETGYTKTYIAKDGNTGKDGLPGKAGVGISSTKIEYAGSTSGTVAPTSGWNTTVPTVAAGNFLWTKTTWTYTDNTTETGYSVARMGVNGATGGKGDTGATGASATSYWITASNNIIGKSQTGVINPTTITFKGFSKTGTANSVAYSGRFIIQTSTNGTTYTNSYVSNNINESSRTYTIPSDSLFVKCLFYMAGGTTVLLDEQTVPIVESAEGIQVGGENLLLNTSFNKNTLSKWNINGSVAGTIDSANQYEGVNSLKLIFTASGAPSGGITRLFQHNSTGAGNYFMMTSSVYVKADKQVVVGLRNGDSVVKRTTIGTSWQKISQTELGNKFLLWAESACTLWVAKPKTEKGTVATDWTQAPEDARTYKAWANSSDGTVDFTRVYPNENLILDTGFNNEELWKPWSIPSISLEEPDGNKTIKVVKTTTGQQGFSIATDAIEKDSWYTLRFKARGNVSTLIPYILMTPLPNYALKSFTTLSSTDFKEFSVSFKALTSSFPEGVPTSLAFLNAGTASVGEWFEILGGTIKIEVGSEPTIYTTNPQDSLSGSIPKYVGFSPIDSDVPNEYEWIMNPEYAQALADEALAGKVDNDAEYENLKNMAQEVKESYENFVGEDGEYKTEHSKLLDRTTAIETDLGEYREQINFVDTYMSAGNEGLIIGVKDSEGKPDANAMQMLLSNKSLSFMDGGEVVAYFSGQSFHINRGAIVESLQVGQHKITNLGNGHTVFQYTG